MARRIAIRELTVNERKRIQATPGFDRLHPTRCTACGATGEFFRRVFEITGVPSRMQCDDDTQGLLQHHFRTNHKLVWVVFKSPGRRFYADSAQCSQCSSTAVTYDISFDDELYAEIARMTGMPAEKVRQQLEQTQADLDRLE